jgi:hypothetical protein
VSAHAILLEGTNPVRLTNDPAADEFPVWMPP